MLKALLPTNQNNVQRTGFAIALMVMLLLIFAHNPFDGYSIDTPLRRIENQSNGRCTKAEYDEHTRLLALAEDIRKRWLTMSQVERNDTAVFLETKVGTPRVQLEKKCFEDIERVENVSLPLREWSSTSPLIDWLGSVVHLFSALIVTASIGLSWIFVFARKIGLDRVKR